MPGGTLSLMQLSYRFPLGFHCRLRFQCARPCLPPFSGYEYLHEKGVQQDTLVSFKRLAEVDYEKASSLAWLGLTKSSIGDTNRWLFSSIKNHWTEEAAAQV